MTAEADRILVLETEGRMTREVLSSVKTLSECVAQTSVMVSECSNRERRLTEYLDRLESRMTKNEAAILVNASAVHYVEKAIYTMVGIFVASVSGITVYVLRTIGGGV